MATLWTTVLVSNGTKLLHGAHTAVVRRLHTLILNMNVRLSFAFIMIYLSCCFSREE